MSFTLSYKGNLKQYDDLTDLYKTVNNISKKYGWHCSIEEKCISIDIPNCETFILNPENGKINGWVKFLSCCDNETIEHFFDLLREIKPYFKSLTIDDDMGMWYNYIAKFTNEKLPQFRELKDLEKEELYNWFNLPKGSTSIFGMEQTHAVIMFMVCKDLSDNLLEPMTKDILFGKVDEKKKEGPLWSSGEQYQFIEVVDTWFLRKLKDKKGNPIKEKNHGGAVFSWFFGEIIFEFWAGSLGKKHESLNRFLDYLEKQKIDFNIPENFLRLIYSTMEYCGGYRSDDLIIRHQ
jgi:hypothetical protein